MASTELLTTDEALVRVRVAEELAAARRDHKPLNSLHEGYAVLLEEVEEFWEQVRRKPRKRDHLEILHELVQVSAMAQRVLVDVVLPRLRKDGIALPEDADG